MWGLISPENEITRELSKVDPDVATKPGWRWLPITDLPIPVYNLSLQILEGPNFNVLEDSVERYWLVRDKTPEEIDQDKQNKLSSVPVTVIDVLFVQENRIRQLEGQPQLTKEEFDEYIKSLL